MWYRRSNHIFRKCIIHSLKNSFKNSFQKVGRTRREVNQLSRSAWYRNFFKFSSKNLFVGSAVKWDYWKLIGFIIFSMSRSVGNFNVLYSRSVDIDLCAIKRPLWLIISHSNKLPRSFQCLGSLPWDSTELALGVNSLVRWLSKTRARWVMIQCSSFNVIITPLLDKIDKSDLSWISIGDRCQKWTILYSFYFLKSSF